MSATTTIKIAYLYEDLMNTYGDSGDVKILRHLLNQQGFDVTVTNVSLGADFDAFDYDFVFFGGGQDFEQTIVAQDLQRHRATLAAYIEASRPLLAICGGYQLLGAYYETSGGTTIKGLGILPLHTIYKADSRMIGDTTVQTPWGQIHAFENHSGRTYFDDKNMLKPLGQVEQGYGNNPDDHEEGLHYKNTIGSYSHGPLLRNLNVAQAVAATIITAHEERLATTHA